MHCNARSWSCLREVLWVMICEGQCKKPHSGQGRRVLTSPSKGCWLAQDRFTLLLKSSWVRPRWISIQASWRAQLKISRGSALILRNFGLYFSTVFSNCISQLYFKPAYFDWNLAGHNLMALLVRIQRKCINPKTKGSIVNCDNGSSELHCAYFPFLYRSLSPLHAVNHHQHGPHFQERTIDHGPWDV